MDKPGDNYLKKELYELIKTDESIFDFIQMSSLDGLWYWDIEKPENEWMNASFWTTLGYNPEEMPHLSDAWQNIINQDDLKTALENFTQHLQNPDHPYDQIVRYTHKNGSTVWIRCRGMAIRDKNGKPIRMLGAHHDITDIKNAEHELIAAKEKSEENEKLLKKIAENFPNSYISVIEKDLRVGYTAGIEFKHQNLNPDDFVGLTLEQVYGAQAPTIRDYYLQTFGGKETSFELFINNQYQLYKTVPLYDDNKEISKILSVVENITSLKIAEQKVLEAKEKAEENERLKTAFLQNMSHEIRTPLNAISGFAGILNKPDLSEEKRKSFVSIIQNSSKQLISIVTDILTISSLDTKQEKLNIEKVCINDVVMELLAIFKQQAQNQNILLYANHQLNDTQSEIYTDRTKVTQILSNLLTNALKFTHEGYVEFGYTLRQSESLTEIEFYVKDSGIGINQDLHEKIFERFRQANENINKKYGGTGLGLAISKAFTELLGGKIRVQSEPEKGSTFYFTIPYNPVNIDITSNNNIQQTDTKTTILVAEDEEYNYLFIKELLIEMKIDVIHAKNGKETIDIFKANPQIDLILMDIRMPVMTGHDAAKIIRELKPGLPIIAQSAYALEHERATYEEFFDDYITKPMNADVLKLLVSKYINPKKKESFLTNIGPIT